ncbi:hypothetical protein ACFPN2_12475 [Steroidobacter flavus]|uniref:Uncharacterized protein n=1 Tax=Steroidobacter flavus TaxID=1842136 RepID=A0ABV8SQL1_9GAMM
MGPLFSLSILTVALGLGLFLAYLIARLFMSAPVAFRAAAVFVVAGAVGSAVVGLLLALVMGAEATLANGWQVFAYLSGLVLSGLVSGALVVRSYLARVRSISS